MRIRTSIFAILLALSMRGQISGQANGPAPQNQPPGQTPLLVGGQFNTNAAPIASGNMTPLQLDSNGNLKVNLQVGSITGAGTSATDTTSFTAGVSPFTPAGGVFNDSLTVISPGVWAAFRMTMARALHANLRDSFGNEYNASNPLPVSIALATSAVPVPVSLSTVTAQNPLPITAGATKLYVYPMGENRLQPVFVQTNPALPLQVTAPGGQPLPVAIVQQAGGTGSTVTVSNASIPVTQSTSPWVVSASGNFGVTQSTSPWVDNISQFGGSNVVTGTGASGAGIPRVTVSNDSSILVTAASTFTENLTQIAGTSVNTVTAGTQSVGIFDSHNNNVINCNNYTPFSLTANGQVLTGVASKQTYICSINLVTATAQNIALVEGTGSTCGTGTAGMAGGATAATGWNFAANGGLTHGSGMGMVFKTATAADNVCLFLSSTGQTSGGVTWTQF